YADALNREITYTDIPPEAWEQGLHKAGLSEHLIHHLVTMAELNRAGRYDRLAGGVGRGAGRPAMPVRGFVVLRAEEVGGRRREIVKVRFLRLQRDHRWPLWYIGKRQQGFLRNHAIPPCTFLTPVGNRGITPCVCVKEPSRSRGVIPTAGDLSVYKGTVFCRN